MNHFPTSEQVEKIKEQYPVGAVVKLISMRDPYCPIPLGGLLKNGNKVRKGVEQNE